MAETEFRPVSFFSGPIWEFAVFPWACPQGHKNHKYSFLTNVKGANWPVRSVEDPYEVTASVLQEFWSNCNRKTAPSFAYSKRVTIPEIRDEAKKHPHNRSIPL